jgi:hypothetical protein
MLSKENTQDVTGDNNNTSGRDTIIKNYYSGIIETEDAAPTVVEEILSYVITNVSKQGNLAKGLPEKLVKASAKINKNFLKSKEKEEVRQHFTYSYVNIALIEEKYRELDNNLQLDIHSHIYSVYQDMKNTKPNIEILRDLFKFFLPPGKEMNSQYVNISKAFVLFFFDDCTIFEKTKQEKAIQTSLFNQI